MGLVLKISSFWPPPADPHQALPCCAAKSNCFQDFSGRQHHRRPDPGFAIVSTGWPKIGEWRITSSSFNWFLFRSISYISLLLTRPRGNQENTSKEVVRGGMWRSADLDNQPSRASSSAAPRLYNLATGNSLSRFIGMIAAIRRAPGKPMPSARCGKRGGHRRLRHHRRDLRDSARSAAIVRCTSPWFVRKGASTPTKTGLPSAKGEPASWTRSPPQQWTETTHASIDTLAFHVALVGIVYHHLCRTELAQKTHIKPASLTNTSGLRDSGPASVPMFFIHGLIVA